MKSPASKWRTTQYAADYKGCSVKQIYRDIAACRLRAVRINDRGDYRTTDEWLDESIERGLTPVRGQAVPASVVLGVVETTDRTVEREAQNTSNQGHPRP